MATSASIRAGLASNLSAITDCQTSAYVLANPTVPVLYIKPDPEEGVVYDASMGRGHDVWRFLITGYVGNPSDIGAQKNLDEWVDSSGATSVKAAVESDRTLGGVADFVRVVDCTGYSEYAVAGLNHTVLGAVWTVEVLASGT